MNVEKRYATDDTFREVANLLFGAGGDEVVAKMNPDGADLATKDKRKRKITAGLSAVGAGAGALGLAVGAKEIKTHGWKATPKLTRSLVPVEIAGLAGELSATHILHNDTKKKIRKNLTKMEDLKNPKGKLTRVAAEKGTKLGKGQLKKLKENVGKADFDVKWEGEISKLNADKQQVFGWASIVEVNGEPVVDLQGDYISIEEVEKAAYTYVQKSRKGGDMHLRDETGQPVHASEMIESFIVTPDKKQALGLPDSTPTGWWVGYQVNDPEVWSKVKSGERTGFSIHGRGRRADV